MSEVPVPPPSGPEGQQPAATETPVDRAKAQLESLVGNVEVGSPDFMAFWDHTDKMIAGVNAELNAGNRDSTYRQQLLLIDERIAQRSSEKPGYFKASQAQAEVLKPLIPKEIGASQGRGVQTLEIRYPLPETQANINYLRGLRTQIASK